MIDGRAASGRLAATIRIERATRTAQVGKRGLTALSRSRQR